MRKSGALVVAVLAAACSKSSDSPGKTKRTDKLQYPVDVAPLVQRQLQYVVEATGSVDAFQQVQITARVAGAVDKVQFTEGQQVKKGDVLATIERDRYAVAVSEAKAAYASAVATEKGAEAALQRRLEAQKESPGLVPGEEIEEKQTAVDTAKAAVDSAVQNQHVADLNLRDSEVRSPVAGTVQTRTVQLGQYLQPGAVLATIVDRDPLQLHFNVEEADAPRLKPGMDVKFTLEDSSHDYAAKITLVAESADPTTRLVPVTAEVADDKDGRFRLRPGVFAKVAVAVGAARSAIVVPSLAVQPTEKGNVVYVVDASDVAHQKIVQTGMHTPNGGIELTRGVSVGDLLVVAGIDPLSDGAPIAVKNQTTLDAAMKSATAAGSAATPAAAAAPAVAGSAQ